jgi:radical SAM protein with 4Fe4S-binding SPASM domain
VQVGLAALGAREVVLIGGEAYLHEGFLAVVAALARAGINPTMTTGGKGVTLELAHAMADAGLRLVSVSIDGLRPTHDRMRASTGSFDRATAALGYLRAAGIGIAANTNLNRLNRGDLEPLYEHLRAQGIAAWQVQLTAPLGRAADRPEMILQPWDLLDVVPRVVALKQRAFADGIRLMPGNNLGYFGPEEALLRSPTADGDDHFGGCQAGRFVMGIESDGAIKGCPSLQTHAYAGATVRGGTPLAEIWTTDPRVGSLRGRTVDDLWGFCRQCPFAATCMGGCTFTAHAILGRPGNNPYCHFRARSLAAEGRRERLRPIERAPGKPFDHGRFELVDEDLHAPDPSEALPASERVAMTMRSLPLLRS